jgi:hypothetical protein
MNSVKNHLLLTKAGQAGTRWLQRDGTVFLDVRRLEELVCVDLPRLTKLPLGGQFGGLADRNEATQNDDSGNNTSSSSGFTNPELEQVAHFLMQVLERPELTRRIPAKILSEIYAFCGIIYEMFHDYTSAEQSHLRALWVMRKLKDCNKEQAKASAQQLDGLSRRRR